MTSARSREGGSALHISLTGGGLGGGKEGCWGLRRGDVTERQKPYCAALSLTPSLKEVKLDTKNCIWETNFFLQDLISLRRIQNFKEIHLSIFSESIALGVTLVSDAPSNLAVPLPLFR